MAIVLPVISFLGLGMGEFAQFFYIKNAFEMAARDAARVAIPATASKTDPTSAATLALARSSDVQFRVTFGHHHAAGGCLPGPIIIFHHRTRSAPKC